MTDPRSAQWDVANKILCRESNGAQYNTTTKSSLVKTQSPRQISSPMQISQTPRPVSQNQTQISETSRSTPLSRTINEFHRLFRPNRKNSPSSGNSSKGRKKSAQICQVTFTVFCFGRKDTKNVPGTEEKVELFLAGIGEKKVAFPFTDSNVEFIETMWENYSMLKDIKVDVFCAERNPKEMVFNQPPPTGYSAMYIKAIINQGRLSVCPQMNLMKEGVVYLENDDMYRVKEPFGIL